MKLHNYAFLSVLLCGCGASDGSDLYEPPAGTGGSGGSGPLVGPAAPPTKLGEDAVAIVGVTNDDQVIYRNSVGLAAIRMDGSDEKPLMISDKGGTVQIRGNVVFLFSDVDWTTNLGELWIWTREGGAKSAGIAMYGEETALATQDGASVAFMNNVTAKTADLVIATPDLATQKIVIPGVGRGSEDTCRAVYGFVQDRMFIAWCPPGSTNAKLERLDAPDFAPVTLATDVNTLWSTDQSGERVFYTDPSSGGWYLDGGTPTKIDAGVGWGTVLPDGSAVLYTVGDQLRRTTLPQVSPTPIVATSFAARAAWTPSFSHSLYSTVVTYEAGTRRDLWLTPTEGFNPAPTMLEAEPTAEISRSAFSGDGKWAVYLTDAEAGKKTLHIHSVDGAPPAIVQDVDTVAAAHGSRLVFSTNRSDPEVYPIKADLAVLDPQAPDKHVMLQTGTTDGRAFYLSSDGTKVVYVMPAEAETASAVYVQDVP